MNTILATKIKDNDIRISSQLFKQAEERIKLMPKINWLCSMDVLNSLPDNKQCDLVQYLKDIRGNYINDSFTLKQIDLVINFI
jgi:hypothetical protein